MRTATVDFPRHIYSRLGSLHGMYQSYAIIFLREPSLRMKQREAEGISKFVVKSYSPMEETETVFIAP